MKMMSEMKIQITEDNVASCVDKCCKKYIKQVLDK